MFKPVTQTWTTDRLNGDEINVCEVRDIRLYELGPVSFPAYETAYSDLADLDTDERAQVEADRVNAKADWAKFQAK